MPRPQPNTITFTIDGREVQAPENMMLADAAKLGDIEIPVFCYEPKLGQPVGACRMCLVEIEGIPKLQTGCSTPVKDGMVVNTGSERVRTAQQAVVEFLLINHPLDCPVCDKGGECPLQDITFGWGGGRSRFIEPKRHFRKPLELSPLIAIDRERCILCYRCVRFSQEISEDYQLVLLERGAHSYVSTFDGHPYVAPFSGNIVELCPVGALTSRPYRFRARPWDIEDAGSICTLCPSQCNVTFTVRDERVLRVLARDNREVDDGWLCDKGRFAYQAIHSDERITTPLLRDGGELRPVSWDRALAEATGALRRNRGRVGALVGGQATSDEGYLLSRLMRETLDCADIDCTGGLDPRALHTLSDPELAATVPDLEFADTVLVIGCEPVDVAPIIDLRIRKGVRRNRVTLAVATPRPSSLDANAAISVRYAPGDHAATLAALAAALYGGSVEHPQAQEIRALADLLRTGQPAGSAAGTPAGAAPGGDPHERRQRDVVIVWGDRLLEGDGEAVAASLTKIAAGLSLRSRPGSGLLCLPSETNQRGLVEAGAAPGAGAGFAAAAAGRGADAIGRALVRGELTAAYLLQSDPLLSMPDRALWERALERASTVIAHASQLSDTIREYANVVFPAESYAEKEGLLCHPDGRVQRLRPAIARGGSLRAGWSVLADLSRGLGNDLGVLTGPMASNQLIAAVPFYAGLTLEELAGQGVRWTEREQAIAWPPEPELPAPVAAEPGPVAHAAIHPRAAGAPRDAPLLLGTYRSVWAAPEVDASPALAFLSAQQQLEISPEDAQRCALREGDRVLVTARAAGANGGGDATAAVTATVKLRAAIPRGTVFLQEGIAHDSANLLTSAAGPTLVDIAPAPAQRRTDGPGRPAFALAGADGGGSGGLHAEGGPA